MTRVCGVSTLKICGNIYYCAALTGVWTTDSLCSLQKKPTATDFKESKHSQDPEGSTGLVNRAL